MLPAIICYLHLPRYAISHFIVVIIENSCSYLVGKMSPMVVCNFSSYTHVVVSEWSGGLYVSPTIAGSRPGGLIAGAWAAMMSLGFEGDKFT